MKIYEFRTKRKQNIHHLFSIIVRKHNQNIQSYNYQKKINTMAVEIKIYKSLFQQHSQNWYWNYFFNQQMSKEYPYDCFYSAQFSNQCKLIIKLLRQSMQNVPSQKLLNQIKFIPSNELYPFKDQYLWTDVKNNLGKKYCSYLLKQGNYNHNYFYLYKRFQISVMKLSKNNILSSILSSVLALRMLESMKVYRYFHPKQLYPNIQQLKSRTDRKIQFIIDFDGFQGDQKRWCRQMEKFNMQMLRKISTKFNVRFMFYCQFPPKKKYFLKEIIQQNSQESSSHQSRINN